MSDPVSAIRALPRFTYLSREDAREAVLAVLKAADVEVMARAVGESYDGGADPVETPRNWARATSASRAAIDALVAEIEGEGR